MTVLATPVVRPVAWSAIRKFAGALLFFVGIGILISAYHFQEGEPVAAGVMVAALGAATFFEQTAEPVMLPVAALVLSMIPFGIFVGIAGKANPFTVMKLMYEGSFGSWFAFQNSLLRAAPLMLTGLCTALPMRVGLVIIGGEGALVIGALISAGAAHVAMINNFSLPMVLLIMLVAGIVAGGVWIMIAGALKHYRGVNETISSLLLIYIAIALMNHLVEGAWRDPASLNKPSTWPIATPDGDMILGPIHLAIGSWSFDMDVHWGLLMGLGACVFCWIIMNHTTFGFAARVVGGNVRAAKVAGLSLGRILLTTCFLAGGAAGLAGAIEVAANQGSCNATITADRYGYTGILVAFLARQNPIAIIPVAILLGGISASNGMLQRHVALPDATTLVLQGMLFLVLLASETYYGKFKILQKKELADA